MGSPKVIIGGTRMSVTKMYDNPSSSFWDISLKPKCRGITKLSGRHFVGTMNVWTKRSHGKPSNSCWDIFKSWIDWQTLLHPWSHSACIVKTLLTFRRVLNATLSLSCCFFTVCYNLKKGYIHHHLSLFPLCVFQKLSHYMQPLWRPFTTAVWTSRSAASSWTLTRRSANITVLSPIPVLLCLPLSHPDAPHRKWPQLTCRSL